MAKTLRNQRINQIIYISVGGAIAAIILFIILFNTYTGKKNKSNSIQLSENSSDEQVIEETNSPLGKKVDELQGDNESEDVQVQVKDDTQVNEVLSEDPNQTNNNTSEGNNETVQTNNSETNIGVEENKNNDTKEEDKSSEDDSTEKDKEQEKDPTFIIPVEGEIYKKYGKEKLIYSDTLKEWTTHLGIDIKADKTTIVKSAADGVVKSIKNDPRYGLTVVVEHKNGFCTVYSNLLTAEFVVVGENVKSGQTIGTVGNSATFEILDDAHLHFEILKDGNSIDPEMYIK
ncbi:MAG: peptidoglycan DD-metalloendopeptidase family protein [Clostridia bacterium]|nr:peptidoglycan DD-metalloendopeptidase family protein [Clostridia bacterium]